MKVITLMQQQQLLQASGVSASRNGYGIANEEEWE